MKCNIIKDLLPLYCEKLTSQDSNDEIEKHLADCADCNELYENMSQNENIIKPEDKNIQPLKKVKKKSVIKIIAGFAAGLALLGTLFAFLFVGVVPASSEDIDITYSGEVCEDGSLLINFNLVTDEGRCIGTRGKGMVYSTLENPDVFIQDVRIKPYRVMQLPFDNHGKNPNESSHDIVTAPNMEFIEGDVFKIEFRDKTVTYNLNEIAEELGLQ
ncbi:MAG: zf-HC2 domain-containing protein [Ruminococcus sp.]|nr:zf-HC2 domain-containing protein [Ruminococcus sp.]